MLFITFGVMLGFGAGFIPGFSSNNLSMLLITFGLISSNYHLAVAVIAIEISYSFFEFLSPIIFGIGNEATGLAVDTVYAGLTEESFRRSIGLVVSGGLVGILIALPLLFFAERIYPIVYSSLKPLIGWILITICVYMIWIERNWNKKFFAAAVFCLSGLLGLLVKNSGLLSSEYFLLPIFIGFYGFSSILSKRQDKKELIQEITGKEKIRAAAIAFLATMFASLIPGMKRGQTSAIALQVGGVAKREEILFILPAISLAFVTISIFVLGSTGRIRSNLAYDIQQIMGEVYFFQTFLFAGTIAITACMSACLLILLAKPIGRVLAKIEGKYIKAVGFCICSSLIIIFTGIYGILLAVTATCISLLSSRLGTRSTHLMGVLLLPTIASVII